MTKVGAMRARYAAEFPEDRRPSRFFGRVDYREWVERAGSWAASVEHAGAQR